MQLTADEKLRKAHKDIMRDRHAYVAAGTMLLGESTIVDDIPTARTDGRNKQYGRQFMESLSVQEVAGIVLHEAVHIMLRHIPRHRDLIKENAQLANIAFDYVDNAFIRSLPSYGTTFVLPEGHLYDEQFKDMTVRQVYEILKKENEGGNGFGGRCNGQTLDDHDTSVIESLSDAERGELEKIVTDAIQQSVILAGMNGVDVPRAIIDAITPEVDWREAMREFVSETMRGRDDHTFTMFNRKRLVDELYMPSVISERVGDVIIAIDTSGSIGQRELSEFMNYMGMLCDQVEPDSVTVLWWDMKVQGTQKLTSAYGNLKEVLKPMGGGGTYVSCVSKYIIDNKISADCIVVLTDGYVESQIKWETSIPTLWVSTRSNMAIPKGKFVKLIQS